MLKHVALPVIVLMVPVAFVVRRVIRQAFGSLEEAATAIEAARGHERGFRIDTSHMPAEAMPFTDAVNSSEEHTSELQSLMRISYAVFCLINKLKQYLLHTPLQEMTI